MTQIVTIHNCGTVGATIYGTKEFSEPESISLARQQLPEVIKRRAVVLIHEAHRIDFEPLSVPVLAGTRISYRQQLGVVTRTEDRKGILVEVEYEIEDTATNVVVPGVARALCH